jgi:alpha-N-arabinofuranosidase
MRNLLLASILFSLFIHDGGHPALAQHAAINVEYGVDLGAVNTGVFGNNFLGYDPLSYEAVKPDTRPYYGFSDFGAGLWDPQDKVPVKEALDLAKGAGITVARFPGGCGSHHYDWKKAVGKDRTHFLFGIDEFLRVSAAVGAEPVITLRYFAQDAHDAADLVEYLNAPDDGKNPNGGIDWALERAKNGHPAPYRVKFFEVGNEVWHGDHRDIKGQSAHDYAVSYLKYREAMKAVDPAVMAGVVFFTDGWNREVLETVKDRVDFGIVHLYPTLAWGDALSGHPVEKIFKTTLALPVHDSEADLGRLSRRAMEIAGKKIPIAITEYNAGFVQDKPVAYRFTLGGALVNAELLRVFLKPQNNILLATQWDFINEYWGSAANGFDGTRTTLHDPYFKRPVYYVFQLYKEHFGARLIGAQAVSDGYSYRLQPVPYLTVSSSKDISGAKAYLMVLNKNLNDSVTADIALRDFGPIGEVKAWVLNGPAIDATNETDHDNVRVRSHVLDFKEGNVKDTFEFTFEPHSLTAIEIKGLKE